ncbi:basic proline-rich protein-like [Canis lupus dingo]|uniref:basic proline-rich protein-like n=1 Tax=Canis lupus dingo TaxID=286419 RepID=UPI000DC69318|nr:basic proline-rich protein-like [Canis lupus dingo]
MRPSSGSGAVTDFTRPQLGEQVLPARRSRGAGAAPGAARASGRGNRGHLRGCCEPGPPRPGPGLPRGGGVRRARGGRAPPLAPPPAPPPPSPPASSGAAGPGLSRRGEGGPCRLREAAPGGGTPRAAGRAARAPRRRQGRGAGRGDRGTWRARTPPPAPPLRSPPLPGLGPRGAYLSAAAAGRALRPHFPASPARAERLRPAIYRAEPGSGAGGRARAGAGAGGGSGSRDPAAPRDSPRLPEAPRGSPGSRRSPGRPPPPAPRARPGEVVSGAAASPAAPTPPQRRPLPPPPPPPPSALLPMSPAARRRRRPSPVAQLARTAARRARDPRAPRAPRPGPHLGSGDTPSAARLRRGTCAPRVRVQGTGAPETQVPAPSRRAAVHGSPWRRDAGMGDAGMGDAGRGDAGRGDAGRGDAAMRDAGILGCGDAGRGDTGMRGAGTRSVGRGDVGMRSVGLGDVGMRGRCPPAAPRRCHLAASPGPPAARSEVTRGWRVPGAPLPGPARGRLEPAPAQPAEGAGARATPAGREGPGGTATSARDSRVPRGHAPRPRAHPQRPGRPRGVWTAQRRAAYPAWENTLSREGLKRGRIPPGPGETTGLLDPRGAAGAALPRVQED